jgi:hypothetical protein
MGRSSKSPTVAAKKPLAVWKKPVKLQPVKFASAFAKGIYDAATGGWKDLGGDVAAALDSPLEPRRSPTLDLAAGCREHGAVRP